MKIKNHKLLNDEGSPVFFKQAAHMSGVITPTVLVMHYTAGRGFDQSLNTLTARKDDGSGVSAHLLVGRDARIAQMVPFNRKAWHAGDSVWKGRKSVGGFSIGIELDNAGIIEKKGNKFFTYFGTEVSPDEVFTDEHGKHWHAYTHDQLEVSIDITKAILLAYPTIKEIAGHSEICVPAGRKVDPGGAFPMEHFRALL